MLRSIGKSLKNYQQFPQPPNSYLNHGLNNLILEETNYNVEEINLENKKVLQNCNEDQINVYNGILDSIHKKKVVCFLFMVAEDVGRHIYGGH